MAKFSTIVVLILIVYYLFVREINFDPESVRGKRVLLTGASSGIGEQVAYRYAELGAKLVITARRAELLEKVAKKCRELGAEVYVVAADMGESDGRRKVVSETLKNLGGLDFLILNHAILHYEWLETSPEYVSTLSNILNVNLVSYVDMTAMLIESLKESGGHIAVVSSVLGKFGVSGWSHYCTSKFALQGYFASLRQEQRHLNTGVSVTVVVFGAIASETASHLFQQNLPTFEFFQLAAKVEGAADALVRGVSARVHQVFYPGHASILDFLNRLTPQIFEDCNSWFYNQRLKK